MAKLLDAYRTKGILKRTFDIKSPGGKCFTIPFTNKDFYYPPRGHGEVYTAAEIFTTQHEASVPTFPFSIPDSFLGKQITLTETVSREWLLFHRFCFRLEAEEEKPLEGSYRQPVFVSWIPRRRPLIDL